MNMIKNLRVIIMCTGRTHWAGKGIAKEADNISITTNIWKSSELKGNKQNKC